MRPPKIIISFLVLFAPSALWALDMRTEMIQKKSFLGISGEFAQFNLDGAAISGSGLKIDFAHAIQDKFNLDIYLSSAVNSTGGVQVSFTGLGGYAFYNVFGNCCQENRVIYIDGKPLVTENIEKESSLQVGLGLDQYFLNGAKTVYSTSGLGVAVNYQFKMFHQNFKAEFRHSQMSSGQNKITGNFFSLGMIFVL